MGRFIRLENKIKFSLLRASALVSFSLEMDVFDAELSIFLLERTEKSY